MTSELVCRRVLDGSDSALMDDLDRCMREAFPPEERVDVSRLVEFSIERPDEAHFLAFFQRGTFVGFAYHFLLSGEPERRRYIAFLAAGEGHRGRGVGSGMLAMTKASDPGAQWLLGIERPLSDAPNATQRLRRLAFYQRNGWIDTGHHAVDGGVDYELLTDRMPAGVREARLVVEEFWEKLLPDGG